MRSEGTEDRVEGFCYIPMRQAEERVITIEHVNGAWRITGSIFLTSCIDTAKALVKCYQAAFDAVDVLGGVEVIDFSFVLDEERMPSINNVVKADEISITLGRPKGDGDD